MFEKASAHGTNHQRQPHRIRPLEGSSRRQAHCQQRRCPSSSKKARCTSSFCQRCDLEYGVCNRRDSHCLFDYGCHRYVRLRQSRANFDHGGCSAGHRGQQLPTDDSRVPAGWWQLHRCQGQPRQISVTRIGRLNACGLHPHSCSIRCRWCCRHRVGLQRFGTVPRLALRCLYLPRHVRQPARCTRVRCAVCPSYVSLHRESGCANSGRFVPRIFSGPRTDSPHGSSRARTHRRTKSTHVILFPESILFGRRRIDGH